MKLSLSYSKLALNCQGVTLMGMGLYFVILRPPMLSEDLKFIQTNATTINDELPGLLIWLRMVFIVLGGYTFASGAFFSYFSIYQGNKQTNAGFITIIVTGVSSVGLMTAVNFMIDSDFKWLLLLFNVPWLTNLVLANPFRKKVAPDSL
jgi:hypothetical protein